ncbi:MAG: LUD domain-containing protein [Peptococcaceae bacterium]|nr:LUD domain-containing protein [Peptococcaceae bacterium]
MRPDQVLRYRIERGLSDKTASSIRSLLRMASKIRISGCVGRWPELAGQVREIKEKSAAGLESLLEQAASRMEKNGFRVFRAATNREALDYISGLVAGGLVIKSKSNAAKEIGLARVLEEKGCRVVESDLGDRICQLGNITPAHPIGPAIHVPVDRVAQIFSNELGGKIPADPSEIVGAARKLFRRNFLQMDVGITGANAIAADTGSVVLTENEGNIRLIAGLAPVHIVVAGIEKIVPTLEDAVKVAHTAAVYGAGQDIGTYITVITGPAEPAEVYVVLLEQGRWEALRENFEETLYCINCGSCLMECPVYLEIGENYGSRYVGGIGVLQSTFRESFQKALESGLDLCLNCKTCINRCPVKIDTPRHILRLRRKAAPGRPPAEKILLGRQKAGPQGEGAAFLIRGAERLLGKRDEALHGWRLRRPLGSVDCRRLMPSATKKTFLAGQRGFTLPGAGTRVAFFTGCLINLFCGEIGDSALSLLRRLGVEAAVPRRQMCCSMPNLAAGDWEGALAMITANIDLFEREGADAVVTACATCGSTLREYPVLLDGDPRWHARAVSFAGRVMDITVFLSGLPGIKNFRGEFPSSVTYHDPCHLARAQGVREEPRALLAGIPGLKLAEMSDPDACCGFGGAFSLKFYQLACGIGSKKAASIAGSGADTVSTGCPGCVVHLRDVLQREGMKLKVMHTVEILEKALTGNRGGVRDGRPAGGKSR